MQCTNSRLSDCTNLFVCAAERLNCCAADVRLGLPLGLPVKAIMAVIPSLEAIRAVTRSFRWAYGSVTTRMSTCCLNHYRGTLAAGDHREAKPFVKRLPLQLLSTVAGLHIEASPCRHLTFACAVSCRLGRKQRSHTHKKAYIPYCRSHRRRAASLLGHERSRNQPASARRGPLMSPSELCKVVCDGQQQRAPAAGTLGGLWPCSLRQTYHALGQRKR